MKIDIDIRGMDHAIAELKKTSALAEQSTYDFVLDLALLTQAKAVEGITKGPASGKLYEKYKPRRSHKASAPGEYPMSDTGHLASKIQVEPPTDRKNPVGRIGTALYYGKYLELKPALMGGRPWLSRALREAARRMRYDLIKRMKR